MTTLYHSNTSEPDSENPLLVRAESENIAMDGTNGKEEGGLLFASGGDEAKLMGLLYAMKKNDKTQDKDNAKKDKPGTMTSATNIAGLAVGILNDRDSMIESPPTGYLYELSGKNFKQVRYKDTGELTSEYISKKDVVADKVTIIEGPDIPMENGVQVFFLNGMSSEEYHNEIHHIYDESEKHAPPESEQQKDYYERIALDHLNKLTKQGKLIHENKERGLPYLNLETGEIDSPTPQQTIQNKATEELKNKEVKSFRERINRREITPSDPSTKTNDEK